MASKMHVGYMNPNYAAQLTKMFTENWVPEFDFKAWMETIHYKCWCSVCKAPVAHVEIDYDIEKLAYHLCASCHEMVDYVVIEASFPLSLWGPCCIIFFPLDDWTY